MKVTYGAIVQRASGRFGGTVHSNWKGIDVVRRFAKPSNPNTGPQDEIRAIFRNLTKTYQMFPTSLVEMWARYAAGKKFIPRNAFIGLNVPLLQGQADFQDLQLYPGDSGAPPPLAGTPVGGVGTITTAITAAPAPNGWAIDSCAAFAIPAKDPTTLLTFAEVTIAANSDSTFPYSVVLSGLAADDYNVFILQNYLDASTLPRVSPSVAFAAVTVT